MEELGNLSECSSGCESGWTQYLEHSDFLLPSSNPLKHKDVENGVFEDEEEEEEEDLSIISDASSGPPHNFHEQEEEEEEDHNNVEGCSFAEYDINGSIRPTTLFKNNAKRQKIIKENGFLDDTASSPAFGFSMKNFSLMRKNEAGSIDGFSAANNFDGKSGLLSHNLGFLQSSLSGNQLQKNQNQWPEKDELKVI